MTSPVLVLGGGVTGMHVATALGELGHASILLEKSSKLGGRVRRLSRTFPFFNHDGFNDGAEFTSQIEAGDEGSALGGRAHGDHDRRARGRVPRFPGDLERPDDARR